jgi:hypothetical protein
MGKPYRDRDEIAIPDDAHVNTYDGRVYVKQADERGRGRRVVIGKAASATTMAPNESFRAIFPDLWERAYGRDEMIRLEVGVGTYSLMLAAGLRSGAYPIAQECYGLDAGNALMDYAAFSLLERPDSTHLFEERMADDVTFCPTARSDSWYSDLFATLGCERHTRFKALWLRRCVELGVDDVWLCVDGGNNDCLSWGSDLPEHGDNKSHDRSKTMASHIEAVDSRDGRPVTYFASEGGVVDSKAFQEVAAFLTLWGMRVRGVILDRGFCTPAVVRTLRELGIDFVIMLPHDAGGYKAALAELGGSIRWDTAHLVSDSGVFGVASTRRVWSKHPDEARVNLFFSGTSGSTRSVALIRRVTEAMSKARAALALGRRPKVEKALAAYVRVVEDDGGKAVGVEYDHAAWDAALGEKGFFAMISSAEGMGPREVWEAYRLRDASEKQYSILESQEGYGATRTHSTASIRSKFAVGFLASVLRHEVRAACGALGLDTNRMLRKVDGIRLLRSVAGIYTPVRKYTGDQLALLSALGVEAEDFAGIAQDYNQRLLNPIHSQKHRLPERKPVHRRGRGRPKGSKNRKTIEREAEVARQKANGTYVEPARRGPGRPKGSKDTRPRKRRSDAGVKRGPRRKPTAAKAQS